MRNFLHRWGHAYPVQALLAYLLVFATVAGLAVGLVVALVWPDGPLPSAPLMYAIWLLLPVLFAATSVAKGGYCELHGRRFDAREGDDDGA